MIKIRLELDDYNVATGNSNEIIVAIFTDVTATKTALVQCHL
jgi:hypothetical protein